MTNILNLFTSSSNKALKKCIYFFLFVPIQSINFEILKVVEAGNVRMLKKKGNEESNMKKNSHTTCFIFIFQTINHSRKNLLAY